MLTLSILPQELAIFRLKPTESVPTWCGDSNFLSVTKSENELSVVCSQELIPKDLKAEKNWKAFRVEGTLDFSLTGILSSLSTPLAEAGISIFAISTFDTDYVLVKREKLEEAIKVLGNFCRILNIPKTK